MIPDIICALIAAGLATAAYISDKRAAAQKAVL